MSKKLKDYTSFQLTEKTILQEARLRCITEMYAKAQPSADYNDILTYYQDCKSKGIEPERIFDRYYLSQEEFEYIRNKYIKAYHFENQFKNNCDLLIENMSHGCLDDCYIPKMMDKKGSFHEGFRGSMPIKPLEKIIGKKRAKKVISYIHKRKNYYHFDRIEENFSFLISLGDSPCTNEEMVKKYWKSQGIDLEIDPRHYTQDDFWCEDNGYLDEDE